jgi:site-specific recombinase XerD
MPYNTDDIAMIKTLSGAYWNKNHKQWSVAGNVDNLIQLQAHFNYWSPEDCNRIYELIRTTSEPKLIELYNTPEHRNAKVCVKLKGYGIDTQYIAQIHDAEYEPVFKRWLIPNQDQIISAVKSHYMATGAKIIHRLYQKNVQYQKKEYSHQDKQNCLIAKYPVEQHGLLRLYTDAMIRTNRKWSTIYTYTSEFAKFAKALGAHKLSHASESDINQYLSQLARNQKTFSIVHTAINAIKYYYQKVIFRQDLKIEQIKRPKREFHLPFILSTKEINSILQSLSNTKHICILYVLYGCGVRLNELLSLELDDVWWDRNQLFIRNGKGHKDRVVNLSQTLKSLLKVYFDEYQPQRWLFEGQDRMTQYSASSVQSVVRSAVAKAGITKKVSPHILRHCFATHLLDEGVQLPFIQTLLGHKDIKTTMIYTHVTTQNVANVTSPLDRLKVSENKS